MQIAERHAKRSINSGIYFGIFVTARISLTKGDLPYRSSFQASKCHSIRSAKNNNFLIITCSITSKGDQNILVTWINLQYWWHIDCSVTPLHMTSPDAIRRHAISRDVISHNARSVVIHSRQELVSPILSSSSVICVPSVVPWHDKRYHVSSTNSDYCIFDFDLRDRKSHFKHDRETIFERPSAVGLSRLTNISKFRGPRGRTTQNCDAELHEGMIVLDSTIVNPSTCIRLNRDCYTD